MPDCTAFSTVTLLDPFVAIVPESDTHFFLPGHLDSHFLSLPNSSGEPTFRVLLLSVLLNARTHLASFHG
jgi:hypothetical protein